MSTEHSRESAAAWRERERILEAFEEAWSGREPPHLEDYLAQANHDRRVLLIELLRVDMECRRSAGMPMTIEAYLERFPELRAATADLAELADFNDSSPPPNQHVTAAATRSWNQAETVKSSGVRGAGNRTFAGDYDLLEELGRGGMGVVYKAWNRRLRRTVAVKMLLASHQVSADHLQRFRVEAEILARFQHPSIVQIYEVGEIDGQPFVVLEFVEGATLTRRLAERPYDPREAAQLVAAVAEAVQVIHEQGIIHRDLKPSNILIAGGVPKVTDFGLARHPQSDLTTTGAVMGTPCYMATEQAQGLAEAIGPRTDVYALGVILYEMTTGRVPFRAPTVTATLQQVIADEPVPPRRLLAGIPRDLETICLKCLAKEPARRYATAAALAQDLRRFLAGEPIAARPTRWPEHLAKWARRQPRVAALLACVLLLIVVSIAGLGIAWREAERGRKLEAQRADAEGRAKDAALEQLYVHRIFLADRELALGKTTWAESYLDLCPESLRQWEWFYLKHRCRQKETPALLGHQGGVSSVAVSPDGALLASASGDGTVRIWDALAGREKSVLTGHKGSVNWVSFTNDPDELLSGGQDKKVVAWRLASGKKQLVFEQHAGAISCVAAHPSEPWIASATFDGKQPGEVLHWDKQTGNIRLRLPGHERSVTCLAFSPDGKTLASASHDRTVILRDAATGDIRFRFREHTLPIACVAFSPDGAWLASASGPLQSDLPGDDEILIWRAADGKVKHRFSGHAKRTVALAFAPHSPRLASAGWDQVIRIWDLNTGMQLLALEGHSDAVMSLAFTPNEKLISGSLDRTLRIWDAPRKTAN